MFPTFFFFFIFPLQKNVFFYVDCSMFAIFAAKLNKDIDDYILQRYIGQSTF